MIQTDDVLSRQQDFFLTGTTRQVSWRIQQLQKLRSGIGEHEEKLMEAVYADFSKPNFETYATELGMIYTELDLMISNLEKWARPQRVTPTLTTFPGSSRIHPEPYGSVLVISPWNYPIQLALLPLIGAVAAGNTVVLKPSEHSANTSKALAELLSVFSDSFISVEEGGVEVNQALLDQPFDYIFFTGSTRVGKIVMEKAAAHLTPLTLELGGKSPCIITGHADIKLAARRVAWGKFMNAGQTCVAPDYVLIEESVQDAFLNALQESIEEFYGESPDLSSDYARIINQQHFTRLVDMLAEQDICIGGEHKQEQLYLAPTVLLDPDPDSPVMQEEIFGPVLPVLSYTELSEAIRFIHQKPSPLALYIFTEEQEEEKQVLESIRFGGGAVNDTVYQMANHHLPFGGVGNSGFGKYHGKASFDLFSHHKSILRSPTWMDNPLRYPPYENKLKWIRKFFK